MWTKYFVIYFLPRHTAINELTARKTSDKGNDTAMRGITHGSFTRK